MADDMAEFYAHKIQERNLAVLERLQTHAATGSRKTGAGVESRPGAAN
jgi:hypothetical protein